ncbi:MAG: GntR family transcriptional regulator [Rhizobiaceae bacterium]|nr:GntR family transcriptional regulator [Rhizobiaceae bacterium]MCV0404847.1 GntR family transcriptional regulator [Rhizobiaceae bacterium]
MKRVLRSSYRTIRDELLRRISTRVWKPGELIPGEEALAEEFGAARATVNRALQELARTGVVERRRKAGTRVVLHPVREARFVIPLVRQAIEEEGKTYRYRLVASRGERVPGDVAASLGISAGLPLMHVRAMHYADDRPYQFEDRWINLEAVPAARTAPFDVQSPNEWLVENAPFSRATFSFLADRAREEEAVLLELREGDPVLVGERITFLVDRPITFVRLVHPPSHRMVSEL